MMMRHYRHIPGPDEIKARRFARQNRPWRKWVLMSFGLYLAAIVLAPRPVSTTVNWSDCSSYNIPDTAANRHMLEHYNNGTGTWAPEYTDTRQEMREHDIDELMRECADLQMQETRTGKRPDENRN